MPRNGCAKAISEGVDRDRAVDESGNQISVFGRVGARPMDLPEQQRLYLKDGNVWKVPELTPNFDIEDKGKREQELHRRIEQAFGENGLRKRVK